MRRKRCSATSPPGSKNWTGRHWMVSLSREEGGQTLAEAEAAKRETRDPRRQERSRRGGDPGALSRRQDHRRAHSRRAGRPKARRCRPAARAGGRTTTKPITDGGDHEGPSRPDGQGEGNAGQIPGHAGGDRRARGDRPVRRRAGQRDADRQVRDEVAEDRPVAVQGGRGRDPRGPAACRAQRRQGQGRGGHAGKDQGADRRPADTARA